MADRKEDTLPEKKTENDETINESVRCGPLATGYVKFDTDKYEEAGLQLNVFIEPKPNNLYERNMSRQLKQGTREQIDIFLMRSREQADRCDFGDQVGGNNRDQITSECVSDLLRRKIWERGDDSLDKLEKGHRWNCAQATEKSASIQEVNQTETKETEMGEIEAKRRFGSTRKIANARFEGTCDRCGLKGHKSTGAKCPVKEKHCHNCGRKDRSSRQYLKKNNNNNGASAGEPDSKFKREPVRMVETENFKDEYENLFGIE